MCTEVMTRISNVHKVNRLNYAPFTARIWDQIIHSGALAVHSTVNNRLHSWDGTRLEILFSFSECREVKRWPAIPD